MAIEKDKRALEIKIICDTMKKVTEATGIDKDKLEGIGVTPLSITTITKKNIKKLVKKGVCEKMLREIISAHDYIKEETKKRTMYFLNERKTASEEEFGECPISMESIKTPAFLSTSPRVIYERNCLERLCMEKEPKCPITRARISKDDIVEIEKSKNTLKHNKPKA